MAIAYVNGDISTNDNVSTVTGVAWTSLGHAAADITLGIWALDQAATTVTLDTDFTQTENHVDQNLRAILHQRLPAAMTGSESGTILYSVDAATLNRMSVAIGIWRGVSAIGTVVRFTEGGTAVFAHPSANNLSITPQVDNSLIVLIYSERSSTGNTLGTLTPPNGPGGGAATIRKERGTGSSGGTYVCLAEFQLGAGTAGVPQAFTQWSATPTTLVASNADMWLVELKPIAGSNFTQTPSDTEGLTDATVFDLAAGVSDAEPLTDIAALAQGKATTETLGATDAVVVSLALDRTASDAAGLTDAALVSRGLASPASDPLGLVDSVSLDRSQAASESLGLSDATAQTVGQGQADLVGLSDSVTVQASGDTSLAPADFEGLSDSTALTRTQVVPETEALTDSLVVSRSNAAVDSLGLSDQVALVVTRDLGDVIALADSVALTASFVRILTETAALTDTAQVMLTGPTAGITVRPYTGTTTRPGPGITPRPNTGTTVRPG